jgi:gliding motility-associated-like protein
MKRNALLYTACVSGFLSTAECAAQGLLNNGAHIVIKGGAVIQIDGKEGHFTNDSTKTSNGKVTIVDTGSIRLQGNWYNYAPNTVFTTDKGSVVLNGDTQAIGGLYSTGFYHLILQGTGLKRLDRDAFVGGEFGNTKGTLQLNDLPLELNSNVLQLRNPNPGAIIKTTGYIISDNDPTKGYGYVNWQIGNGVKNYSYVFPFATNSGQPVPFAYSVTKPGVSNPGISSINVATYPTDPTTNPNNRPLPTGVSNLDNEFGVDNAPNAVDRYWIINPENYQSLPQADITFTYADPEWNSSNGSTNEITEPEIQASIYDPIFKKWALPPFGINDNASNTVTVKATSLYTGNWTLLNKTVCPVADAQFPVIACLNDSVQLTDLSTISEGKIVSWSWDFADGDKSTKQNPKHAWKNPGTYYVTLRAVSAFGCSDTFKKAITFYQLPVASFSSSSTYCIYDSIQFTDKSNAQGLQLKSWDWDFGDGATSSLQNPKHRYSTTGKYTVQLIITNQYGCKDTIKHWIEIYPQPVANFTHQPEACQEDEVDFKDKSTIAGGKINAWLWNFGDGFTSADQNPSHRFKGFGNFQVQLVAFSEFGCTDTFTSGILIHAKPVAFFDADPDSTTIVTPVITFTNKSSNYNDWHWDFGDQENSKDKDPVHEYLDTGSYTVTLFTENTNGCLDTFSLKIIIAPDYRLWLPNAFTPNNNRVNEVFKPQGVFYNISRYEMLIFDRWGQIIYEGHNLDEGWNGRFNNSGPLVPDGVYIYKITLRDHLNNYHNYRGNVTVFR